MCNHSFFCVHCETPELCDVHFCFYNSFATDDDQLADTNDKFIGRVVSNEPANSNKDNADLFIELINS
jgi:hypothetical protein